MTTLQESDLFTDGKSRPGYCLRKSVAIPFDFPCDVCKEACFSMHMISHEQEIAPGAWSMKMMAVRWGHKDCLLKEADKLSTYVYAKGDWIPSLTYNVVDLTEVDER